MIKGKFLLTAVLALFLASCGDDEAPQGVDGAEVKFTAGFVPMQTAGADTRLTTNDNWAGLADRTVAIEIDGIVKPYTEGVKLEIPVVNADQSGSGYWESDHLEVVTQDVPFSASDISFRHRNTQIVCDLSSTLPGVSYNNIIIKYLNLQNVEKGTVVRATAKGKALIVPQTITAGTEFMEVTLPDERTYTYILEEDLTLGQGIAKGVELEVSEGGINVTFKDLSSWDMSEDSLEGNIIENKPDTDNDNSWDNAGNGTIGGSTIENQPSTPNNGGS